MQNSRVQVVKVGPKMMHQVMGFCLKLHVEQPNVKIGFKIDGEHGYVATNVVKNRNYNDRNYKDYYGLYVPFAAPCVPIFENAADIRGCFNDDAICKITRISKIYRLEHGEKPETKPEAKSETKPETKSETKPETKSETKPATKPETKHETSSSGLRPLPDDVDLATCFPIGKNQVMVQSKSALEMTEKILNMSTGEKDKFYESLPDLPYGSSLRITKIGKFYHSGGMCGGMEPIMIYSEEKQYKTPMKLWDDLSEIVMGIINKQSITGKKVLPKTMFIDRENKFIEKLRDLIS